MPSRNRPTVIAIALACAIAHPHAGAQAIEGLRLKLDRQLMLAPKRIDREAAKFLEADRIEGDREHGIVATGDVTLRQRGASIRADRVEYTEQNDTALATGNVRLEREGSSATGPRLTYHPDAETGEMDSPVFAVPKLGTRPIAARGAASRAMLEPEDKSRLFNAIYTSCPVPRNDWYLSVRELEIDSSRNVGTAYNSTVFFLGVPILYTPYMTFPIDNARKSGFLAPTFGTSGQSGFEMSLPYYWNIAENRDATVTPKLFTKRGLQVGGEFRYLEPTFSGQLDGEYLPNDRIADRDRYFVGVRHTHKLPFGITAALNAQKVSDDDYFRDLSTRLAATSQVNLPRDGILAWGNEDLAVSARALAYQTLQDPLNPVDPPYRMLPQLLASGIRQDVLGADLFFSGEASSFRHPTKANGERFLAYPSVQYPMRRPWGYVTPKVGYHFTHYDTDPNTAGVESGTRTLPIASVDAGIYLDRPWEFGGRSYLQTLEPRLYYLYVPFRDQTRLPNFTTAEMDFNYAQVFSENRFIGGDRIGDANQVTIALGTRVSEADTGLERVRAALAQVYYFEPRRVRLNPGEQPQDTGRSDVLAVLSAQVARNTILDAAVQYAPSIQTQAKIHVGARYFPQPGSVVNASYRFTRDSNGLDDGIEQVDVSAQWPITSTLTGVGRVNWSLKDKKLLEGLAGFEYNAGCWQVRAVAHRFITATQQVSTSFQIQLELTGLSRIGINPLETLRQNISGYRRSDEIVP
jgi:LPS-assembly protein